jgi:hypothetical protein
LKGKVLTVGEFVVRGIGGLIPVLHQHPGYPPYTHDPDCRSRPPLRPVGRDPAPTVDRHYFGSLVETGERPFGLSEWGFHLLAPGGMEIPLFPNGAVATVFNLPTAF